MKDNLFCAMCVLLDLSCDLYSSEIAESELLNVHYFVLTKEVMDKFLCFFYVLSFVSFTFSLLCNLLVPFHSLFVKPPKQCFIQ